MRQVRTFSDERLNGMCSYCGDLPDTRDHVPSKILLDEPFPENLPVVPCCNKCNQNFSLDEEYIACLIECIIHGTTDINKLKREKIKRILSEKESLRQKLEQSIYREGHNVFFKVEQERLKNVILKLVRGHAKFENSEPQFDLPIHYSIRPLTTMTDEESNSFLKINHTERFPEVGSRAMINLIKDNESTNARWIIVQQPNYSYNVNLGLGRLTIKIIIWEYLAAEIVWE
jgi:hypothetical protein